MNQLTLKRHLYLLGGDPNMVDVNKEFIEHAGGKEATIALLFANSEGWEEFLPLYSTTFEEVGVKEWHLIMPSKNGQVLTERDLDVLQKATGIFIGGGVPLLYYLAYVKNEQARAIIRAKFESGVPIAACSAGALILPTQAYLLSMEGDDYEIVEGMGLVENLIIGVHYTEFNQAHNVAEIMDYYGIQEAYGIDEDACAHFENSVFKKAMGKKVHLLGDALRK